MTATCTERNDAMVILSMLQYCSKICLKYEENNRQLQSVRMLYEKSEGLWPLNHSTI